MKISAVIFTTICVLVLISCNAQQNKVKTVPGIDDKIIGKWQSESDSNSVITFKDSTYQLDYEGENILTRKYAFSDTCYIKVTVKASNEYILVLDNSKVEFCFYIYGVDQTTLSLLDNSTGHIMVFKRKK